MGHRDVTSQVSSEQSSPTPYLDPFFPFPVVPFHNSRYDKPLLPVLLLKMFRSWKRLTSYSSLVGRNPVCLHHSIKRSVTSFDRTDIDLLQELRQLDTAAICDADKMLMSQLADTSDETTNYKGIKLLQSKMRPVNALRTKYVMVGMAKTVKCTKRNDFLAVLRGLMDAKPGDVLMVDTCNSDRAVAGELFCLQSVQNGLEGLVVDGPVRDTSYVGEISQVRCYSTSITPYSGTTLSPGMIDVSIMCGGVIVNPGDIVVGDNDGLVVADATTFAALLPQAKAICTTEEKIKDSILNGASLDRLTNCTAHIAARIADEPSSLSFTVND